MQGAVVTGKVGEPLHGLPVRHQFQRNALPWSHLSDISPDINPRWRVRDTPSQVPETKVPKRSARNPEASANVLQGPFWPWDEFRR